MRMAPPLNGDKLVFLSLHSIRLVSREEVTKFVDIYLMRTACCPVVRLSKVWDADQV